MYEEEKWVGNGNRNGRNVQEKAERNWTLLDKAKMCVSVCLYFEWSRVDDCEADGDAVE